MPPMNLLIKPASSLCNMNCTYCFYHDVAENRETASYGIMSEETLEQVIKKALRYADSACHIAFQGGEPTVAGLPFFKKAVELARHYNEKKLPVTFALQTNGYHLDDAWAEFFAENHFLLGVSVDGTIHTHNAYRKDNAGKDTFLEVMKSIQCLKKAKVDFNILTVVNRRTAASARKIYEYYRKMDFGYLQFIPCLDPLAEKAGTFDFSLTPEAYGRFLCEIFDLWYEDWKSGRFVSIRMFDNYLSILLTGRAESCDMNGFCSIQNVVEADGSVYPCDFFVLDEWKLGNLNEVDFGAIHEERKISGFLSQAKGPDEECRKCTWFPLCRGGCYRHRFMAPAGSPELSDGSAPRNYFCRSYQMFFAHSIRRLEQIAGTLSGRQ
ncbi:MAG: anaerobic sulfatase maturase [Lachnospiraceae bacterium]|nr:anaerobic sulfatase maturase [Lachnospiraceae bacterium]